METKRQRNRRSFLSSLTGSVGVLAGTAMGGRKLLAATEGKGVGIFAFGESGKITGLGETGNVYK
ncbi:MAG TPA: hypothetical protein VGY31_16915, partial [Terriglobia bacterium]|nr:hypothetical protein [Terriglobia bacterium]